MSCQSVIGDVVLAICDVVKEVNQGDKVNREDLAESFSSRVKLNDLASEVDTGKSKFNHSE